MKGKHAFSINLHRQAGRANMFGIFKVINTHFLLQEQACNPLMNGLSRGNLNPYQYSRGKSCLNDRAGLGCQTKLINCL